MTPRSHSESEPAWVTARLTCVDWLTDQILTYYTSSISWLMLQSLLYYDASNKNLEWAIRWEAGERDTIFDELPWSIGQYLQLEPM